MDPPAAAEVETKSEKPDVMERAKSYDCGLCDTEVVYKIAQELLPGLASACVDNTTGGIFTSAGSVAVDMRKEMADYLTQRSETYVAEFLLSENTSGLELSEHPYDIIINLIDDFAASKRNMFSRVSEWVLSDRREDRIDDFVQEMEINGFWLLARRECVASMLLKNVDYKNAFHCNMVCSSEEEIAKHRSDCKFRPMDCTNEGCTTRYCAAQKEHHEAVCPFMILPCEQKCSDFVMRREMDRHCVTICPMKLVSCAFYTVGCKSNIPRCNVQQHNADDLSSHLLYIIRTAHKEASDDDLKHRVEQIRSLSNVEKLARARDTRALTYLIKDAEAKLGPLEVKTKPQVESPGHEDIKKKESPTKTEPVVKDGSDPPNKKEEHTGSQPAIEKRSSTEKPVITEKDKEETRLPTKEVQPQSQNPVESTTTEDRSSDSSVKIEENKDKEHADSESPMEKEVFRDVQEEESNKLAAKEKEQRGSPIEETHEKPSQSAEEQTARSPKGESFREESSNTVKQDSMKSPKKETVTEESSSDEQDSKRSFEEKKNKQSSSNDEQDSKRSFEEEKNKHLSSNDEQDSKRSFEEEKNQQLSSSDEKDTKQPAKKESVKESVTSDAAESTKSTEKETVKESSHQQEKTHELSDSDDEESMKSPSEIL